MPYHPHVTKRPERREDPTRIDAKFLKMGVSMLLAVSLTFGGVIANDYRETLKRNTEANNLLSEEIHTAIAKYDQKFTDHDRRVASLETLYGTLFQRCERNENAAPPRTNKD